MKLYHYWFEFDLPEVDAASRDVALGCGVTAFNRDDALWLIRETIFAGGVLPSISCCQEDVDRAFLEMKGIRGKAAPLRWRGIWYPLGYSAYNSRAPEGQF